MKVNNTIKPGLAPLVVSVSLMIILAVTLFLIIAGDSSGAPETGWSALVGMVLLGPPLLILLVISLFLWARYIKLNDNQYPNSTDNKNDYNAKDTPPYSGPPPTVG